MQNAKLKFGAIFFIALGLTGLRAQEAIPASGGSISSSGGSVSYSVGQIVYTTEIGTNGSVAQGVQQAFEISVVTELEETNGITLKCALYPNPAVDYLILKIENYNTENLIYELNDLNGKLIEIKKVEGNETIISMKNLVPAIYFLKINDTNKKIKIFRIIKN